MLGRAVSWGLALAAKIYSIWVERALAAAWIHRRCPLAVSPQRCGGLVHGRPVSLLQLISGTATAAGRLAFAAGHRGESTLDMTVTIRPAPRLDGHPVPPFHTRPPPQRGANPPPVRLQKWARTQEAVPTSGGRAGQTPSAPAQPAPLHAEGTSDKKRTAQVLARTYQPLDWFRSLSASTTQPQGNNRKADGGLLSRPTSSRLHGGTSRPRTSRDATLMPFRQLGVTTDCLPWSSLILNLG